jgi:hypothetical protein
VVENLGLKSLWMLARYLPAALIRWRFPPKRLASLVYLDLRPRHDAVVLELHPNGMAHLYLQVINLCPARVELDRACFSLICGGSEIKFVELAKREFEIGEIAEIYVRAPVPSEVADAISRTPDNAVSLYGHIEFNSPVRTFPKTVGNLEGIRPRFVNLEQRQRLIAPSQ